MNPNEPRPDKLATPEVVDKARPEKAQRGHWITTLLFRNPFYLASAALLLFGIDRLSIDPTFLGAEGPKLTFNFASLELYEVLLVGISLVLGTRKIWYDSILLVVLENALLLVPFMLLAQALLLNTNLAVILCICGTGLAILRFGCLRRWMPELQLPRGLIGLGFGILLLNMLVPLFFPGVVTKDEDNWQLPSLLGWFLVLPMLAGMAAFLPRPMKYEELPPRKSWLPLLIYGAWIGGTAGHLLCLDYIGNRQFHYSYFAPLFWAGSWIFYARLRDVSPEPSPALRGFAMALPFVLSLFGIFHPTSYVCFGLAILNLAIYAGISLRQRQHEMAMPLMTISAAMLVASIPFEWGNAFIPNFTRERAAGMGVGACVLFNAMLSRQPIAGFCGACVTGLAPIFVMDQPLFNPALHAACLFLLMHSLRWTEGELKLTRALRFAAAVLWTVHALIWVHADEALTPIAVSSTAAAALIGCMIYRHTCGKFPRIAAGAALVNACAVPLNLFYGQIRLSPIGLLCIIGSFVLLGMGTGFAWIRHKWQLRRNNAELS